MLNKVTNNICGFRSRPDLYRKIHNLSISKLSSFDGWCWAVLGLPIRAECVFIYNKSILAVKYLFFYRLCNGRPTNAKFKLITLTHFLLFIYFFSPSNSPKLTIHLTRNTDVSILITMNFFSNKLYTMTCHCTSN